MSGLWEFFFCPIHGVLAPRNWPILCMIYTSSRDQIVALYLNHRYHKLRKQGAL